MSSIDKKSFAKAVEIYRKCVGRYAVNNHALGEAITAYLESAKSSEGDADITAMICGMFGEEFEDDFKSDFAWQLLQNLRPYLRTPAQVSGEAIKEFMDAACAYYIAFGMDVATGALKERLDNATAALTGKEA